MRSERRWILLAMLSVPAYLGTMPTYAADSDDIHIAPHRAIYDMSLLSSKQDSELAGVSGQMLFEWQDGCGGWDVKQRLLLDLSYAEGSTSTIKTSMTSWEAKDGKSYDFDVSRLDNGKPAERFRGHGEFTGATGLAHYAEPTTVKDIQLESGTLFPSAHTIQLIKHAEAGEHTLMRTIFDGSDEEGKSDASAFIGKEQDLDGTLGTIHSPLLRGRMWPIHLAFYPSDKGQDASPDYEMTMDLLDNGVAESMTIDYGDFVLKGKLKAIEPLPKATCD